MDFNIIIETLQKLVVWLLRVVHCVPENTKRGTIPLNQVSLPPEELSALLETNFPPCALFRTVYLVSQPKKKALYQLTHTRFNHQFLFCKI